VYAIFLYSDCALTLQSTPKKANVCEQQMLTRRRLMLGCDGVYVSVWGCEGVCGSAWLRVAGVAISPNSAKPNSRRHSSRRCTLADFYVQDSTGRAGVIYICSVCVCVCVCVWVCGCVRVYVCT
jgi:hypothetical protein